MIVVQSEFIKHSAQNYGFALCGIARAKALSLEKERFESAITQNLHANKEYLERDIDKRFHPKLLLKGCQSVIVCGFNYNMQKSRRAEEQKSRKAEDSLKPISQYAQIKDYHVFMKEKLEVLANDLQDKYGKFNYKITVDSSAISEKAWAVQAGIGYYGKNGIIQTPFGSFVFLGCLLIDSEVDMYDTPNHGSCGECSKCLAVCPAKAIVAPYQVNSNQCISNINLNKNETDFTRIAKYGWLIGCDECQNVCPHNANAPIHEEAISLRALFVENQDDILSNLTPESFEEYFKETAIYKLKYEGLKKRIEEIYDMR